MTAEYLNLPIGCVEEDETLIWLEDRTAILCNWNIRTGKTKPKKLTIPTYGLFITMKPYLLMSGVVVNFYEKKRALAE